MLETTNCNLLGGLDSTTHRQVISSASEVQRDTFLISGTSVKTGVKKKKQPHFLSVFSQISCDQMLTHHFEERRFCLLLSALVSDATPQERVVIFPGRLEAQGRRCPQLAVIKRRVLNVFPSQVTPGEDGRRRGAGVGDRAGHRGGPTDPQLPPDRQRHGVRFICNIQKAIQRVGDGWCECELNTAFEDLPIFEMETVFWM